MKTMGLNQEELIEQDGKEKSNKILSATGYSPTMRDESGNILLYDDSIGEQYIDDSQTITIDIIKSNFDAKQVAEIIDTTIYELFNANDLTEISKLRSEIENLRQQLKNAETPIIIQNQDNVIEQSSESIPNDRAITLPDKDTGIISDSELKLGVTTAIFDDETFSLKNFNGANPFSVKWTILNHDNDEIYASGKDITLFEVVNANNSPLSDYSIDIDVILELTNPPTNFNGWFINNQSTGLLNNYQRFSSEPLVRFRLLKRKEVGVPSIDDIRNYYYIVAAFTNEVPKYGDVSLHRVIVGTGLLSENVVSKFNRVSIKLDLNEVDVYGNLIQSLSNVQSPITLNIYDGNLLNAKIISDSDVNDYYDFQGWYTGNDNNYTKISNSLEFLGDVSNNLLAVYTFKKLKDV